MKTTFDKKNIGLLPNTPGVYFFYGSDDLLLYVGKSRTIRTRVRSHFTTRGERWLTRRVRRIETCETAGELGALLLESKLIKELRPMYNVRDKQTRRIIIARGIKNESGYLTVKLEPVDYLDLKPDAPILGVFKHKTQAKEFLDAVSKTHRLCPKLLRLESCRGYCFSYHLGQCNGACMGEEKVEVYNSRVNAAFEARRIVGWPFRNRITIEEVSKDQELKEEFVIDNWCLVSNQITGREPEQASYPKLTPAISIGSAGYQIQLKSRQENASSHHRFDYDTYKILYSFVMEGKKNGFIRIIQDTMTKK
jgi:DNA polymerase-3 subunit epsilon